MIVVVSDSPHPEMQDRKRFFDVRIGSIDTQTVVHAELDENGVPTLCLKKYTESEWDETQHETRIVIHEGGYSPVCPMGFSLNRKQRDALVGILTTKQHYGMTGWEFAMTFWEWMSGNRGISLQKLNCPDLSDFPVLEDGYYGVYDRWYSGSEVDRIMFTQFGWCLGGKTFAFWLANADLKPEKAYFKIVEMAEEFPGKEYHQAHREDTLMEYGIVPSDEILRWCRISAERPEYITGYDECMVLTAEQRDAFIREVRKEWPYLINDYNSFVVSHKRDVPMMYSDTPIPDYSLLPVAEEV